MTDRLLVDIHADGGVSVSVLPEGGSPGSWIKSPAPLEWPLDLQALEDLRWYLEDYLSAPFGVYEDRGQRIKSALPGWGRAVFESVFAARPIRDVYERLRARSSAMELLLRSASAQILGLPWELMADADRQKPIALDGVAITRTLPDTGLGKVFRVRGERLRVLMVISRPAGAHDVEFRLVARPLLERLAAVSGEVDLVVLRPPTLDALVAELAAARQAGEPFQVVHFDGHGVRTEATPTAAPIHQTESGQGGLLFERPTGGPDLVSAETLARILADARVPVVVLNACQSGTVGIQVEAGVASRMLQEGAAAVVAMAYNIYAVAAAEFMTAFYEAMFSGGSTSAAMVAGRERLARYPNRPSPKGEVPLADWVIPVHYARDDVRFPYLRRYSDQYRLSLEDQGVAHRERSTTEDRPLAPVGEFVGRDALFYELEVALRLQRIVILHGMGGIGKTELAKAFGRWWRDTGGVEQANWVVSCSFEFGGVSSGLHTVLATIGLQVFGSDFARLDLEERRDVVLRLLRERRLLVILDSFESLYSMPDHDQATSTLEEAEREELRQFLTQIAASGRSAVLITSRSTEAWLDSEGPALTRIRVGGLNQQEANEYADQLLAPFAQAQSRRTQRAFGELLQVLQGHPLSMRLILPELESRDPGVLLDNLRGVDLSSIDSEVRGDSLAASSRYSFQRLDSRARGLLVALSLFRGIADADVLHVFSMAGEVPARFRAVENEVWRDVLDQATEYGLLASLGAGMYQIHPALHSLITAEWRHEAGAAYDLEHEAAERAMLRAYGQFSSDPWSLRV